MRQFPLCNMEKNECAAVVRLETKGELRHRLMDIGLVEGTTVECVRKSPAGDPKAYLIRGAVIALRNEDAATVIMEGTP